MDFITWAGIRFNHVNQLKPSPADVLLAGEMQYNGDGSISFITGFKEGTGDYRGTVAASAKRIDLTTLFTHVPPVVPVWRSDTVYKVIMAMNGYYGLAIDPSEIVEAMNAFDWTVLPQQLTITAKADALSCEGSIALTVVQKVMTLSDIVETTDVTAIVDESPLAVVPLELDKRYYGFDFTPWRHDLPSYQADPVADTLLTILNDPGVLEDCGHITWTATGGSYNLSDLTFVYNGVSTGYAEANQSYRYVAVFAATSTNMTGRLFLHYDA